MVGYNHKLQSLIKTYLIDYLLIEKNKTNVERINSVLTTDDGFNCIGTVSSYEVSMKIILKEAPSLVLINLDNTLDQPFIFKKELNQFVENVPEFIGISSEKEKAYHAIKNNFFDFYLTPIQDLDILKSKLLLQKKKIIPVKKTICLKSYNDFQYINTDDILFLKADNNTTDFYMENGNVISAFKTLKTYETSLPENFIRIHKSYVINKNFVFRINFGKSQCAVKLDSNNIPFSNTYADKVRVLNHDLIETSIKATS